ncbi:methyl-CpG-binding domain-containing protein [Trifolium repens]|jgi:hypothetical protein|nr:methyl-CpG-binding domain-containing protein [Trifolium repens]
MLSCIMQLLPIIAKIIGDKSFRANQFGGPRKYSTFNNWSVFGFQRAFGAVIHAIRVGSEDILNHIQYIARSFVELPCQT